MLKLSSAVEDQEADASFSVSMLPVSKMVLVGLYFTAVASIETVGNGSSMRVRRVKATSSDPTAFDTVTDILNEPTNSDRDVINSVDFDGVAVPSAKTPGHASP